MEIGKAISLLEQSKFTYALDSTSTSKKQCLDAIKLLNSYSKSAQGKDSSLSAEVLQAFSKYLLSNYESFNASSANSGSLNNSFDEKFKWLASKINGSIFPPVIEFNKVISTFHHKLIPQLASDQLELELPPSVIHDAAFLEFSPAEVGSIVDLKNLYQDLLTNCSFVCAILALIYLDPQVLRSRIVSDNSELDGKKTSISRVKLYLNGCNRLVTINNTLPVITRGELKGRNLAIRSSTNSNLCWPAFLEKAFLTIMGQGYNFEGSNMALDVYMLAEWLPEVIRIQNGQLPPDVVSVLVKREGYGNVSDSVVLGLGVGSISKDLSDRLGLIPEHDYSIVGSRINNESGLRELEIRNPWKTNDDNMREGSWWIQETQLHNFSYLYVNWNANNIFSNRSEINFFSLSKVSLFNSYIDKPQINLTVGPTNIAKEVVWLLLERHLPSKKHDKHSEIVINLNVYDTEDGCKVLTSTQYQQVFKPSVGTNNRTFLAKLELPVKTAASGSSFTVIIDSTTTAAFTLKGFSNTNIKLTKAKPRYAYTLPITEDEWSSDSRGGNFTKSTFIKNPQYTLAVSETSDVTIGLFGESANNYYNFHVFACDSEKSHLQLSQLLTRQTLIKQENYKMGGAVLNFPNISAGHYRVVFSTYETLQDKKPLKFKVYISSSTPHLSLTKCHTSLGLFIARRKFVAWKNSNRIKINFKTSSTNTNVKFHIQFTNFEDWNDTQSGENSVHFQSDISDYRPAIRASIFNSTTEAPVVINDGWDNSLYGIFVEATLRDSEEYILLIERFEMGSGGCIVDAGSNRKISYA